MIPTSHRQCRPRPGLRSYCQINPARSAQATFTTLLPIRARKPLRTQRLFHEDQGRRSQRRHDGCSSTPSGLAPAPGPRQCIHGVTVRHHRPFVPAPATSSTCSLPLHHGRCAFALQGPASQANRRAQTPPGARARQQTLPRHHGLFFRTPAPWPAAWRAFAPATNRPATQAPATALTVCAQRLRNQSPMPAARILPCQGNHWRTASSVCCTRGPPARPAACGCRPTFRTS